MYILVCTFFLIFCIVYMLVYAFLNIPAFSFFVYIYVCIAFSRQQEGDAARILRPHILYAAAISGYMPASCSHIFNAFLNVFFVHIVESTRQQAAGGRRRPHFPAAYTLCRGYHEDIASITAHIFSNIFLFYAV